MAAVIVLVVAAVTEALFFYYAHKQDKALNEIQVGTRSYQARIRTHNVHPGFLRHHSKRAQEQMTAQHEVIGNMLEKLDTTQEKEKRDL